MTPLTLLSVHAHPDDEASKGAATVARYKTEGVHAVLVTCTGGEEGDILNAAMDTQAVRENLAAIRYDELRLSARIIGYDEVVMLGYHDSGMPDSAANKRPDAFANADHEHAVARLVEVIRRVRPHVVVTYGDDQTGYPHPDHLMVHEISVPAFSLAGDASFFPDLGTPWTPMKLYYSVWSHARILATHSKFKELGIESPFDDRWFDRPSQDGRITTRIEVADWYDVRMEALLAHATQVDPNSPFWFGLPIEVARELNMTEDYILARSNVATEIPEVDLFAGIR